MSGFITNIERFTIRKGQGIRLMVFFQGCPLSCCWCHNPECIPSFHKLNEQSGKEYTEKQLLAEIKKERELMNEPGGGVMFSGGEPLLQPVFLKNIINACRKEKIPTTIDTSGLASSSIFEPMLDFPDLLLFNLKIIDDDLHRKYTGMSNKLILKNLRILDRSDKKNVIVQVPLVPGFTDTEQNIRDILEVLAGLPNLRRVNLLPYSDMVESKYIRLNVPYKLFDSGIPDGKRDREIKELFISAGFNTSLGS